MDEPRPRRIPETLIGLVALAVALAVAVPVTAVVVMDGIRDIKRTRDTIVVTGSAKQPIQADLANWNVTVSATERSPEKAARILRAKVAAVAAFLDGGGLPKADVSKPPLGIEQTTVSIPTGLEKPRFRDVPAWHVYQTFSVSTHQIDTLERTAAGLDQLLAQGVAVNAEQIQYLSTRLTAAKFGALRLATANANRRAETIAEGLGGHLGAVRSVNLGVYQIIPRNSTEVSGEGISDTGSRLKDVEAVVSVTFAVER